MQKTHKPDLVTPSEAAQLLGLLSVGTVSKWAARYPHVAREMNGDRIARIDWRGLQIAADGDYQRSVMSGEASGARVRVPAAPSTAPPAPERGEPAPQRRSEPGDAVDLERFLALSDVCFTEAARVIQELAEDAIPDTVERILAAIDRPDAAEHVERCLADALDGLLADAARAFADGYEAAGYGSREEGLLRLCAEARRTAPELYKALCRQPLAAPPVAPAGERRDAG